MKKVQEDTFSTIFFPFGVLGMPSTPWPPPGGMATASGERRSVPHVLTGVTNPGEAR